MIANLETLRRVSPTNGRTGTSATARRCISRISTSISSGGTTSSPLDDRVWATFRPRVDVPQGRKRCRRAMRRSRTSRRCAAGYREQGSIGHSARSSRQRGSAPTGRPRRNRIPGGHRDPAAGRLRHARQPVRLDAPTATGPPSQGPECTSSSTRRRVTTSTACASRWTVVLPDGTTLPLQPSAEGQGFEGVIEATQRQNFLVPPRRHRSFPLSEFQA